MLRRVVASFVVSSAVLFASVTDARGDDAAVWDVAINGAFVDDTTLARHVRRDLAVGMTVGLAAGYATMLLLPNDAPKLTPVPVAGGAMLTWSGLL